MSDEYVNCGACGDKRKYDEPHDCWVVMKFQNQENLLEMCPVCFEPIAVPHWRCENPEHSNIDV